MGGLPTGRVTLASLAAAGLLVAGCSVELSGNLSEAQADEIVLALDAASIAAERERERGGDRYRVTVTRGSVAAALAVLHDRELPREEAPDLDTLFERGGLFESPDVERARYAAALGGELARTIETIEGVARARVHLALAPRVGAQLDEPPPPSRASVLVHVERGADVDDDAIRALVRGAVTSLDDPSIEVVRSVAPPPSNPEPSLARVGPFAVSRADAPALKAVLAGTLALNLLLALFVVALVRNRRTRSASMRSDPTPET